MSADAFASDLMTKLGAVTGLSIGMALGGRDPDPSMTKIPLPAAWVLLAEDKPNDPETALVPTSQMLLVDYVVMAYVPYISQSDLINTEFPLLRAIRTAIHSTNSPNGNRWKYLGQRLVLANTDRLGYEQRYRVLVPI